MTASTQAGQAAKTERLGPIHLMPGVTPMNVVTKLYAAFICIGMLTGMSILQGYILTEHLGLSRGEQGNAAGTLAFWTEIVAIFLITPFGVLSDRIGRRPVLVFGIVMMGIGYGLYPFAETLGELLFYRMFYAVGMASVSAMLASITNDYPQDRSRGKLIGISSALNVIGVMFISGVIAQIPNVLIGQGYDSVSAGKVMFLVVACLGIITALLSQLGLKGGTVVKPKDRSTFKELMQAGLRSAKNPRISLAYAGAFAARSDLVIKALFLSLWAIQDGRTYGLDSGGAMARFGLILTAMSLASLIANPFFGWFIDRVNRVTAFMVALAFASIGYASMGIITSPLDYWMMPYFIVLSLGSSFMLQASLGLIGQEAPIKERGSIIALSGMFGAIGILIFSKGGGIIFDAWGPWAPFVVAGTYQAVLFVIAGIIRVMAPGDFVEGSPWKPQVESDEEEPLAASGAIEVTNTSAQAPEKPAAN